MKKVVILGAGYGGLTVAHRLRDYFRPEEMDVTVISRERTVYENTIFPALLTDDVREDETRFDAMETMGRRGNHFVEAEVEEILTESNEVRTSKGTFDYDYLVVALGGAYEENFSSIPGSEHAFMHHPLTHFLRIKERLLSMDEVNAVIGNSTGSPIEGPSYQLALIIMHQIRSRGIKGSVTLVTQSPKGVFGMIPSPGVSEAANRLFMEQGINLVMGDSLVEARRDKVITKNGREVESNLTSILPKLSAPKVVRDALPVNKDGYVDVELPSFRVKGLQNVFAVGDLAQGMVQARTARGAMIAGENVASTLGKELKGIQRPLYRQGVLCVFHGGGIAGMLRFDVDERPRVNFVVSPIFTKLKIIYSRLLVRSGFNVPYHAAPTFA
ncbi:FAD-dependent oxidoreductase [Metallosphaera tengchongensis]|uniref:FAD-dependent oxidoreductase n=1 Tax=Metallosphaera tengchongensis TaxID=1532350 RepID=A0A6N0NVB9_9CREN|nr:FAD-dependent oxidoreductase [Metallosphaera tengchongensis]QKR00824.1 FAD-dependent oxidoreductase [Metallosphaera tengchongensis]